MLSNYFIICHLFRIPFSNHKKQTEKKEPSAAELSAAMEFVRFACGAMGVVGTMQYMYGHEFVLNFFTIFAVLEQVDFIWRMIDVGLVECFSRWWKSSNANVLLAG